MPSTHSKRREKIQVLRGFGMACQELQREAFRAQLAKGLGFLQDTKATKGIRGKAYTKRYYAACTEVHVCDPNTAVQQGDFHLSTRNNAFESCIN